jgi:hypothetical protein
VRFNNEGSIPSLEICSEDMWIPLQSDFQSSSEGSVIRELKGSPLEATGIILTWEAVRSTSSTVVGYNITCSSENMDVTLRVRGGSEAATLTRLAPLTSYHCCVVATLDQSIFNLVTLTSRECVSVSLGEAILVGAAASESGLSTVTIALGALVGLLIVVTIVVAVSCIFVMLSKRKYQVTHPR